MLGRDLVEVLFKSADLPVASCSPRNVSLFGGFFPHSLIEIPLAGCYFLTCGKVHCVNGLQFIFMRV